MAEAVLQVAAQGGLHVLGGVGAGICGLQVINGAITGWTANKASAQNPNYSRGPQTQQSLTPFCSAILKILDLLSLALPVVEEGPPFSGLGETETQPLSLTVAVPSHEASIWPLKEGDGPGLPTPPAALLTTF